MLGALDAALCASVWMAAYPEKPLFGDENTTPGIWSSIGVPESKLSNPSCVSPSAPAAARNDSRSG